MTVSAQMRAMGVRRRFDRGGILAINPRAFNEMFATGEPRVESVGNIPIVDVRGPLDHHAGGWFDSYEAIQQRVAAACVSPGGYVLLRVDSPGGDMSGCVEASRAIRAMCDAAGKTLIAYVDGSACSAAYALACAAHTIVTPETGMVGSAGVIYARIDQSEANTREGLRIAMITSGARKADGNPMVAMTADELASTQAMIDSMAGVFFALVEDMRPGLSAAAVQALEAGIYHGASAVSVGLADVVMSFEALTSAINGGDMSALKAKAATYADARAALEEIAKGEDANAKSAQRALAAMDGDPDEKKAMEEPEEEAAAPAAEAPLPEEEKKPEAMVSAKSAAKIAAHAADVSTRLAALELKHEASDRAALLASRPDVSKELRAVFANQSLSDVRATLSAMPIPARPNLAAAAVVQATRGEGSGADNTPRLPPIEAHALKMRMGMVPMTVGVVDSGNRLTLGAPMAAGKNG